MVLYLLQDLREVLGDDSEGSAGHSKVIALFLPCIHPVLQVHLHRLKERKSQYHRNTRKLLTCNHHACLWEIYSDTFRVFSGTYMHVGLS